MAYFPDLSPYAYSRLPQPGVVHIGWLDDAHDFPKGAVPPHLLEKLKALALHPVEIYRGFHICELCTPPPETEWTLDPIRGIRSPNPAWEEWTRSRRSHGEIRVRSGDLTYAAPMNLPHYIEAHKYLPPEEFLRAVHAHILPS